MHAQFSDQNVLARDGLRNRVAVRIDLNQLATAHQALQVLGEFVACGSMESQFSHQLLEAGRAFGLALDLLQYGGIGKSVQDRGLSTTQTITRRQLGTVAAPTFQLSFNASPKMDLQPSRGPSEEEIVRWNS